MRPPTRSYWFQPLDVLRTEMQRPCRGKTKPHLTTSLALQHVVANRGWTGLWCGLVPTVLRVGVGMGVYFFCLNRLGAGPRDSSSPQTKSVSSLLLFSSGAVSRGMAALIVQPLTVIKTRFEAGDRAYGKGVFRNLVGILKRERLRGIFRGVIPTILRDAPFSGIYLLIYTRLSKLVSDYAWADLNIAEASRGGLFAYVPRPAITFATGVVAGALGTIITNPADLVRTRMQLRDGPHGYGGSVGPGGRAERVPATEGAATGQRPPKGFVRVTWEIAMSEGVMVFFMRGILPRILKRSLQSALTWTMYTGLHSSLILLCSSSCSSSSLSSNCMRGT